MKKTPKVNIYSAELMFERLVEQAIKDKDVKKPIAWALYHTWKWANFNEKIKKEDG